jgi:hypothetical protein
MKQSKSTLQFVRKSQEKLTKVNDDGSFDERAMIS